MAATITPQVQHTVQEAAELSHDDLAALIDALQSLPRAERLGQARHAVIEERVRRVQAGGVFTLALEEIAKSIRSELDF